MLQVKWGKWVSGLVSAIHLIHTTRSVLSISSPEVKNRKSGININHFSSESFYINTFWTYAKKLTLQKSNSDQLSTAVEFIKFTRITHLSNGLYEPVC